MSPPDQSDAIEFQPTHTEDAGNPSQFGLSDLFALMTLVSMLSAIFAPAIRAIYEGNGASAALFLVIECALVGVCGYLVVKQRRRSLELGGAKLGSGFCGVVRWKYWPRVVSWFAMLVIATFEIAMSLLIASFPFILLSIQIFIIQLQLAFFTSRAFLCFWSRVYPNSIEFFERGIVLYGTWFLPWEKVTVRPSTLYPDRIVVVYQMQPERPSGNLCVVQVTDHLRKNIFAAAVVR